MKEQKQKNEKHSTPMTLSSDVEDQTNCDIKDIGEKNVINIANVPWKKNTSILFIAFISIFLFSIGCSIYFQEIGTYMNYWSEKLFEFFVVFVIEGIMSFFLTNRKLLKSTIWLFIFILVTTLIIICFCALLKVYSEHINNTKTILEGKNITKENDSNYNQISKYTRVIYNFDEDPFFDRKEEYFGVEKGSLSDDEILEQMVKVILTDMEAQECEGTKIPKEYSKCTKEADLQYETYLFQRKRDWNKKDSDAEEDFVKKKRINDLLSAIKKRIRGDEYYKNAENRRIIALYYKDRGDEYAKDEKLQKALEDYEDSAEWAMKSIYTAYINGDYNKMKEAYKCLDNATEALNELKEVGGNKDNISICRSAYKLLIDEYIK